MPLVVGAVADWLPAAGWLACGVLAVVAAQCWLRLRGELAQSHAAAAHSEPMTAALAAAELRIADFTASQERFAGNLALEIQSPLALMLRHADVLVANGNDRVIVDRYTRGIAEGLRHMLDLVASFLRLSRPLAHEDTSSHAPVHIHDLVLEAMRRCQSLALTRSVRVVSMLAESPTNAAVEVMGDAVLLGAMIENLVRNGVLSAPHGTRVDLHVTTSGDAVLMSVRDRGPKLDDDRIAAVFEGFFQVPPPRPSLGTGLSLAIAKRVAEHHRGTITLRNVPDGGCEFAVQLPRWRPDALPTAPPG